MSTPSPRDVARRFIGEIYVAGRADAVDQLVTPDFVSQGLPGSGPEVMKAASARVASALSEANMEIEDVIAEGDRVAVRLLSSAVQPGEFMGMLTSGKRYTVEEIHNFRVRDSRVAEHWNQFDQLGMIRQLGALPGTPPGGQPRGLPHSAGPAVMAEVPSVHHSVMQMTPTDAQELPLRSWKPTR